MLFAFVTKISKTQIFLNKKKSIVINDLLRFQMLECSLKSFHQFLSCLLEHISLVDFIDHSQINRLILRFYTN